jgi:hypothetical protein
MKSSVGLSSKSGAYGGDRDHPLHFETGSLTPAELKRAGQICTGVSVQTRGRVSEAFRLLASELAALAEQQADAPTGPQPGGCGCAPGAMCPQHHQATQRLRPGRRW